MKKRERHLGELEVIETIRQRFSGHSSRSIKLGIGDDCAILRPPVGSEMLVTTDFTLEGRHFRRDWHSPESVGHRCLTRGLSDLAAMGGTPVAAFLSLALPASTPPVWTLRFLEGLHRLAKLHAVPLAGGDTAEAPDASILADIVLIGSAPSGQALRRSGGRSGDILYVTGALGGAAAELNQMRSGTVRKVKTGTGWKHPQMFPEPRLALGQTLLKKKLASACMDLSDGLSTDLAHLCRASGVGAEVDAEAIPIHPLAAKLPGSEGLGLALNGGEDYELLFTSPADVRVPAKIAGIAVTAIGRIVTARKGITLRTADGTRSLLLPGGWEHFKTKR